MDDRKLEGLLERGVKALESMAEDPVIEMPTGPPVCPHCERINPTVRVSESEATGPLGEFVIQAHCVHCNSVFYGVPVLWDCLESVEAVQQAISERQSLTDGNNSRADQGA